MYTYRHCNIHEVRSKFRQGQTSLCHLAYAFFDQGQCFCYFQQLVGQTFLHPSKKIYGWSFWNHNILHPKLNSLHIFGVSIIIGKANPPLALLVTPCTIVHLGLKGKTFFSTFGANFKRFCCIITKLISEIQQHLWKLIIFFHSKIANMVLVDVNQSYAR